MIVFAKTYERDEATQQEVERTLYTDINMEREERPTRAGEKHSQRLEE